MHLGYSHPETVALLLFGRPFTSHGSTFDFRFNWLLLLRLGRCTLRIFATEATGKLASIIRVNVRVVLSPRNRYVCETVVNQQFAFVCVHVNQNSVAQSAPGCCGWSRRIRGRDADARGY